MSIFIWTLRLTTVSLIPLENTDVFLTTMHSSVQLVTLITSSHLMFAPRLQLKSTTALIILQTENALNVQAVISLLTKPLVIFRHHPWIAPPMKVKTLAKPVLPISSLSLQIQKIPVRQQLSPPTVPFLMSPPTNAPNALNITMWTILAHVLRLLKTLFRDVSLWLQLQPALVAKLEEHLASTRRPVKLELIWMQTAVKVLSLPLPYVVYVKLVTNSKTTNVLKMQTPQSKMDATTNWATRVACSVFQDGRCWK